MKKTGFLTFVRLFIGACAGLAIGMGSVAVLAGVLVAVQAIRSILDPAGLYLGERLASIINLPVVVFGLPFTDGIVSPGILTGLIAHRLRSMRSLVLAGLMTGWLFDILIRITYSVSDVFLFAGFIVLEVFIAFAVSMVDGYVLKIFIRCPNVESKPLPMKYFLMIGGLLFLMGAFLVNKTCYSLAIRHLATEEQIDRFVRENQLGSKMVLPIEMDLRGWVVHGLGKWSMDEGILSIRRGSGYLATFCEEFSDLILEMDVRVNSRGNSGIFFRAQNPGFGLRSQPVGYEAQIDYHDSKNPTGSLYNRATAFPVVGKDEEWFHMKIVAIGPRIQIHVNGERVVDATDSTYTKGMIALQAHDPYSVVSFENLCLWIPEERPVSN